MAYYFVKVYLKELSGNFSVSNKPVRSICIKQIRINIYELPNNLYNSPIFDKVVSSFTENEMSQIKSFIKTINE